MKIEPSKGRLTTKGSASPGRKAAIRSAPFAQELREASREDTEDLDELLAKVDELAERLIAAPSLELLAEYKAVVGEFPPAGPGPGPQAGRTGLHRFSGEKAGLHAHALRR